MPWSSSSQPARPSVQAQDTGNGCTITWQGNARKWVLQVGSKGRWFTMDVLPGNCNRITLPARVANTLDRIAIRPISPTGMSGAPGILAR